MSAALWHGCLLGLVLGAPAGFAVCCVLAAEAVTRAERRGFRSGYLAALTVAGDPLAVERGIAAAMRDDAQDRAALRAEDAAATAEPARA